MATQQAQQQDQDKDRKTRQEQSQHESGDEGHVDDDDGPAEGLSDRSESDRSNPHKRSAETAPSRSQKRRRRFDPFEDDSGQDRMFARQQRQQQPQQNTGLQHVQQQQVAPKDEKKTPLKLRLDLNLDVDIQLCAKIHGDVTLALLDMG